MRDKDGNELLRVFRVDCSKFLIVAAGTKAEARRIIMEQTNYYSAVSDIPDVIGIKNMWYRGKSRVF